MLLFDEDTVPLGTFWEPCPIPGQGVNPWTARAAAFYSSLGLTAEEIADRLRAGMNASSVAIDSNRERDITRSVAFALRTVPPEINGSAPRHAVGSVMLADADYSTEYDPARHKGHADTDSECGMVQLAVFELKREADSSTYDTNSAYDTATRKELTGLADILKAHFLS